MLLFALLPLLALAWMARAALREEPLMRAMCPDCCRTFSNQRGLAWHTQASHPNTWEVGA